MTKFIITIDTEGDNLWARPYKITTNNIKFIPRFQNLCEEYGFQPTYLVNYEIVEDKAFIKFAKEKLKQNKCEIGMHLHAWNSPPEYQLTNDDYYNMPYLIEYPQDILEEKIDYLTKLISARLEVKPVSHRAGRWAFNEHYASILEKYNYLVDCSVTPGVSWKKDLGDPSQKGGTDYSDFQHTPYFLDIKDIRKGGTSTLLEIPATIISNYNKIKKLAYKAALTSKGRSALERLFGKPFLWFRPYTNNIETLKFIVDTRIMQKAEYIMLMFHSSELMPGGSPSFKTNEDIEKLYINLNSLFFFLSQQNIEGINCKNFYNLFVSKNKKY